MKINDIKVERHFYDSMSSFSSSKYIEIIELIIYRKNGVKIRGIWIVMNKTFVKIVM